MNESSRQHAVHRSSPDWQIEWRMLLPWGLSAGLIGAFYLLGVPICPMHQMLGIPCPGCGMTRATVDLLELHFADAWHMHPLVFVVVPVVGWTALSSVVGQRRVRMPPVWLWVSLAVAALVVWGLRLAGIGGLAAL